MIDIAQYITDTNRAKTSEEAFLYLERQLASLGFDRVVFTLLTDHPYLNKKRQHGVFRNYPEDWMKYYFKNGYLDIDPTIKVACQREGAFPWQCLPLLKKMSATETTLMQEATEAKLLDGIVISLHSSSGQIAGMGVASSVGGADSRHRDTLSLVYLLCTQYNNIYQALERDESIPERVVRLSEREREILTWLAVGKSMSVVADILCISENSVKTYLRRVFTKLGVRTKQQAIVHAIRMGFINPQISTRPERVVRFSEREREILTWLAVGKSMSVVADILCISENSVKTYLRRVFTKLGVRTKQQAIVHGIRMGFINPQISTRDNWLSR